MIQRSPIKIKLEQCIDCKPNVLRRVWKRINGEPLCQEHTGYRAAKRQIEEGKASKKTYDDFCRHLWKTRKQLSDLSGQPLPEYDQYSPRFCKLIRFHMHHVKPEGKESKSKRELGITLDESKIIFVTYDEHQIIEFGSDKQKEEIGWTKFLQTQNQLT